MAKKKAPKSESKSPDTKSPVESPEQIRARIDTTLERMRAEANSPGRESKQSLVRYPNEEMRVRIARLAKANGRSINAEIIDRLQKSMIGDKIANLEEMVAWLSEQVEELKSTVKDHAEQLRYRK